MKNIIKTLFVLIILLAGVNKSFATAPSATLTIRDGATVIFTGDIELQENSNVLSLLNSADTQSEDFEISNIEEFPFGKYLKCINYVNGERCDDWQYVVNNTSPFSSIDQTTLSGGENVYVYFGPQNKIILGSSSITTNDAVTLTAQNYDYENDAWVARTSGTVGLTQPNPLDQWNPTEIMTSPLDAIGQATFKNIPVGSYNVGIKEDYYFPTEPLTVTNYVPSNTSGGGGSSNAGIVLGATTKLQFNVEKAFKFLASKQKEDGSFGDNLYTDWVALGLASGNNQEQVIKLIKNLVQLKIEGGLLTDHERHAMALMSLGLNPYNTNGENYIKKITESFDGKQFGDINEDNDDIFALIVLQNAGFIKDEKMILDSVNFVLSRQKENGSWDESIDMTGASIQALVAFNGDEKVKTALEKAKEFLKKNQKPDGGFGNASATSWAIGGILAIKDKPEDWKKNDNTPYDYMANNQDTDGAIKNEIAEEEPSIKSKIWETAYAVTAMSGKTWNEILQDFEKPKDFNIVSNLPDNVVKISATVPPRKINQKKNTPTIPVLNIEEVKSIPEVKTGNKNWFMKFINFIF